MIDLPTKPQQNGGVNFVGRMRSSVNHTNQRNEAVRGLDCFEFTNNTISPIQDAMYSKIDQFKTPVNTKKLSVDESNTIKFLITRQGELEAKISNLEARLTFSDSKNELIKELIERIAFLEDKIDRLEMRGEGAYKQKLGSVLSIEKSIKPGQGKKFILTDLLKNFQMKTEQKIRIKGKSKQN